jgi:2-oxoisovalerate dehydrogenase E1 component
MGALRTPDVLELYRGVVLVRRFEEAVGALCRDGEIPGLVHLFLGQGASAVGACWPLRKEDVITLTTRASGYGLQCLTIDGDDVVKVAESMNDVVGNLRSGGPPVVVEAISTRWHGHYEGDQQRYRDQKEIATAKTNRDSVTLVKNRALHAGVSASELELIDSTILHQVESAISEARNAPPPDPEDIFDFVVEPRRKGRGEKELLDTAAEWRTMDALSAAPRRELEADESVFVAGIDVTQGPFAITRGLVEDFGKGRVRFVELAAL